MDNGSMYWGIHPLSSTHFLNIKETIEDVLFSDDEMDEDLHLDDDIMKLRVLNNIYSIIDVCSKEEHQYILPFFLQDLGVLILDADARLAIRGMIGDGGANLRGLRSMQITPADYKSHYNEFSSPLDYANHLRDNWDNIMTGAYSTPAKSPECILEAIGNNTFGPCSAKARI